jgi:hypothetical protein
MRLSDVDFLRRPAPPVLGWVLLAIGLLAVAGSLRFAQDWRQQRSRFANHESILASARQAPRRPVAPLPPTLPQRRWEQARQEQDRPWNAALGAIETATREPVYLLSMVVDPATGSIRLEGEAPAFDQALAYVQTLAAQPALSSATLESHADMGAGAGRIHFSALAHWKRP